MHEPAINYHVKTKHHFNRFARSLGYLDWANQPDPFRRFEGAELFHLPIREVDDSPPYSAIYDPSELEAHAIDIASLSELFYRSLAISAWKQFDANRWSLRCNPSSGNLHPTEGYLIAGPITGLSERPAVYHYAPLEHAVELRCTIGTGIWNELIAELPPHSFLLALTSIHWREAWKYGERAYRYCQHDVGHALAAVSLAAASLGWNIAMLDRLGDDEVATLLGLDRDDDFTDAEREHPDLVVVIHRATIGTALPRRLPASAIAGLQSAACAWTGRANPLSREHVDWPLISVVEEACRKPAESPGQQLVLATSAPERPEADEPSACTLFRQRRSAVALDGRSSISAASFAKMLSRVVPQTGKPPWNVWPFEPAVHLALFVHRVDGLQPGIYALPRVFAGDDGLEAERRLQAAMRSEFLWQRVHEWPDDVPLRLLVPIDCRASATRVSCDQAIAGEGAFSLGMIAEFENRIRSPNAWFYRRLFWEAGMIGQVLYLEAEACGVRATGIGCYYDDPVHDLLGIEGIAYQSMYHFTTGTPIEDTRLQTHEAYDDARRRRQIKR